MRKLLIVLGVVGLIAVGAVGYLWLSGGSGQPSTDLTTPATAVSAAEGTVYVISPEESVASFSIDEVLRGEPQTVIGTTSEVAGQISVDPSDLSIATLSEITVNARTFETDSPLRDRAIRGPLILDSATDELELIVFSPTAVTAPSGPASLGRPVELTVTGDLTIKETTGPVTFDVSATLVSEERLEGTATAQVQRADFGIGIPDVFGVTGVSEDVTLTFEVVALAG